MFTIRGRELAQEIRDTCSFCKRFKAKLVEVEIGKIHEARLTIAPPFTLCQVDLFGPLEARCEHNHRSVVKVWGVVFKDPASGAVFVHAMAKCNTSAFVQAYTRFAARFCHPKKLYPDEGSQLLKACNEMEIRWVDISHTLSSQYQVGVEFSPCPVGGHNYHGQVERITPNRLIQGRANKRAMSGPCSIENPTKMLEKMDDVFDAWWRVWSD